jgi:hypothetical protein
MSNGIVYFIQPGELLETDVYKVGYSSKLDLRRLLSYKKNTNYFSIIQCNDALKCEEEIKKKFKENFKLHAGNEFFKGDKEEMLVMFNKIVNKHIKNSIIETSYNQHTSNIVGCDRNDITLSSKTHIKNTNVVISNNRDVDNKKDEHKIIELVMISRK